MGKVVAVSGKGGVGKTTITALLVQELLAAGAETPLLVVDGDPAATLHFALGVASPATTLAHVRDEMMAQEGRQKVNPVDLLTQRQVIRTGERGLHLLEMGHGEGRGCYCGVNAALSFALRQLLPQYPWVVLDNEAGTEHLSRKNMSHIDFFIVVTLPQLPSQAVARRIVQTARAVETTWTHAGVVVNRCSTETDGNGVDIAGLPVWATLPEVTTLPELERLGQAVTQLPAGHPLRCHMRDLATRLLREGGS